MEEPLLSEHAQQKSQRLFPDSFYCPLTMEVMIDPVVGEDGVSYERRAVMKRDNEDLNPQEQQRPLYYPNRAVQKIIIDTEERLEIEQDIVRSALHRAGESLIAGHDQVLEKLGLQTKEARPLHDVSYCPITLDIIMHPAIDPDGNSYESRAIRSWVRRNGNSPLTRNKMDVKQLRSNNALKNLIALEVSNAANPNDPSIRRWKAARKRIKIEDEENRLADLREGSDEYLDNESGPSLTLLGNMSDVIQRQRGSWAFFFATALLMVSWCIYIFVRVHVSPLLLLYVMAANLFGIINLGLLIYLDPHTS